MNQEQIDELAIKVSREINGEKAERFEYNQCLFARRLVAEIQARNEPIYLCWEWGAWAESSIEKYNKTTEDDRWKLYTFPPDCGELSKDAERMDWLSSAIGDVVVEHCPDGDSKYFYLYLLKGLIGGVVTLREVIDAAIAKGKTK